MKVKIDILTIDIRNFNTELKALIDVINSLNIEYYILAVDEKICVLIETIVTLDVLKNYVFRDSIKALCTKKYYQNFVKKSFITFKYRNNIVNENDLMLNNVYDITYKRD